MPRPTPTVAVTLLAAVPLACSPGTLDVSGKDDATAPSPSGDAAPDDEQSSTDDTGDEPAADTGDTRMSTADSGMQSDADGGEMEDPEPPSGNELPQEPLFVCGDQVGYTEPRIRRLGRDEWRRTTTNATGSIASTNPFDPAPTHQYSTYATGETIDESMLDIYLNTVSSAAWGWKTRDKYGLYGYKRRSETRTGPITANEKVDKIECFYADGRPDSACVETFVEHLLERGVLFRPATDAEVNSLVDFAEGALDDEAGNDTSRSHTIDRIVSAAWMTTGALFRDEMGDGERDDHGRRRLGDWELAQAIAYALDGRAAGTSGVRTKAIDGLDWNAGPEGHMPKIRQAAIDGTISEPETIAEIVRSYYGGEDPERTDLNLDIRDGRKISRRGEYWMANGIRDFFREWLGYPPVVNIFKDTPSATTTYEEGLHKDYGNLVTRGTGHEPTLVEEMDDMIARIIAKDTNVFERLMTTRTYYTPASEGYDGKRVDEMNHVYNISEPTADTREARWKTMPEDERAGVLTHPAFLAAHAGNFENDPSLVHRGKWIREKILCGSVPDVPITVNAALDPDTRDQSARKRMKTQVDSRNECAGCHAQMNPLGYPFEIYNHAGILRNNDHGMEPNGSSELVNMPTEALEGPVDDAVEMSEKFAESTYVKRCFIRQTFRYFMGRDERRRDACTLAQMEQAYDQSDGSFTEMLIALFQSDTFLYRADPADIGR